MKVKEISRKRRWWKSQLHDAPKLNPAREPKTWQALMEKLEAKQTHEREVNPEDIILQEEENSMIVEGRDEMDDIDEGAFSSTDFNGEAYLSEAYKNTSFDQLKTEYDQLQETIKGKQQQSKVLVKDNFTKFVGCREIIDRIHSDLTSHETQDDGSSPQVEAMYKDLTASVQRIFDDLLAKKTKSDKIKKQLKIINGYQYIFSAPMKIRKNIQAGNFEKAQTQFKKISSLLNNTQVPIFQQLLTELQKTVQEFISLLYKQLKNIHTPKDEAERIIRVLVELGCKGDPVWDYLQYSHQEICKLLNNVNSASTATSDATNQSTSLRSKPQAPSITITKENSEQKASQNSINNTAAHIEKMVKQLSDILVNFVPKHWKVTEAFVLGNIYKGLEDKVEAASLSNSGNVEKKKTRQDYEALLTDILNLYSTKVKQVVFGKDGRPHAVPAPRTLPGPRPATTTTLTTSAEYLAMKEACISVSKCDETLKSTGMQKQQQEIVTHTMIEVTRYYLDITFQQLFKVISFLHTREDWKVEDAVSVSNVNITRLPNLFAQFVNQAFNDLQGVVQEMHPLMKLVEDKTLEAFNTFADCFHHLAFVRDLSVNLNSQPGVQVSASPFNMHTMRITDSGSHTDKTAPAISELSKTKLLINFDDDKKMDYRDQEFMSIVDRRLILILSNCRHTRTNVMQELERSYTKAFKINRSSIKFETPIEVFRDLEQMILNRYIRNKTVAINSFVKKGIFLSGVDWQSDDPPTDVNRYVLDVLLYMVFVHQEVIHTLEPQAVQSILALLTGNLFQSFLDCLLQIPQFTKNGLRQVEIDIQFAETVMKNHIPGVAGNILDSINAAFDTALVVAAKQKSQDVKPTTQILQAALASTNIMFESFLKE